MIQEMRRYLRQGDSFAFETTLSGRSYALHIQEWQSAGYRVGEENATFNIIRRTCPLMARRPAHPQML